MARPSPLPNNWPRTAGVATLQRASQPVDAAIGDHCRNGRCSAPPQCGMGGDCSRSPPTERQALRQRRAGRAPTRTHFEAMATRDAAAHDIRTVTLPGCVDGWTPARALRTCRCRSLAPRRLSPCRVRLPRQPPVARACAASTSGAAAQSGETRRRFECGGTSCGSGVAAGPRSDCRRGRGASFLRRPFGEGPDRVGKDLYLDDDLARTQADWVGAAHTTALAVDLHTTRPNSQDTSPGRASAPRTVACPRIRRSGVGATF